MRLLKKKKNVHYVAGKSHGRISWRFIQKHKQCLGNSKKN